MKELMPIGVLIVFIGMALIAIGALSSLKEGETKTKVAIGGFIGLFPFGFANDKRMLYFVVGLSLFMFVFFILMSYLWR